MFRKYLLIFSLALPLAAVAANPVPQVVRRALSKIAAGASISYVSPAPMPGFYQALVHGSLVYVSNDGRYVMAGQLFDAEKAVNLTEKHMDAIRLRALAKVPAGDRLIYAPPHPKYTVTVFTDLDCTFCRIFHQHIAAYNAEGIAVQYLFWPRTGLKAEPSGRDTPSYLKAVSVWCSKDRKKAFDEAMRGKSIRNANCPNPVAREYHLGERIGVDGTPIIIAEDGSTVGGYLGPRQLLQAVRMASPRQGVNEGADGGEASRR